MANEGDASGDPRVQARPGLAVRSAMLWNLAHHGVSQLVAAAVFLYLAARLDPVVFGVFALASLLVDAFAVEARSAAVDLIVAGRHFSARSLSTFYYVLLAGGFVSYAAVVLACGVLGGPLQAPGLAVAVAALGLNILVAPRLAAHEALAVGELRFRALATRNIAASLVSAAAAVLTVMAGAPEWALVTQRLAASLAGLLTLARLAPWRPARLFDGALAKRLTPSFGKLWLSQLVTFGLGRIPDLLIGARLGVGALGLYRVAARLADIVQSAVTSPLAGLLVPVLSRFAGDLRAQAEQYRQIAALTALLTTPALAGLALLSGDIVHALLAPHYAGVAPLVALLAAAGLAAPFAHFRGGVLIAAGQPGAAAMLALLDLAATAAAVWFGAAFGLTWAAAGVLLASGAAAALSSIVIARALASPVIPLVAACAPPYLGAGAMAIGLTLGAPLADSWPIPARLAAGVATGAVVFVGWIVVAHRRWLSARLDYLRTRKTSAAT
jgi:O-antigen/teichoic acid export membrane protein